ncbi:V-set and immunoglobulin domain-containing protein 2 isoform X2 [Protopterus annectens]|nr:V-set and immunoglobulin domain-containing protein 2 isoform X2 [Protopterus annectens]
MPSGPFLVKTGETTILPCLYKTTEPISETFVLEWKFKSEETVTQRQTILYYSKSNLHVQGSQKDRIMLQQNPPTSSDGSIQLQNIQPTDSGFYFCSVTNPPDFSGSNEILINLTVLEPPSVPVCKMAKGKLHVGNNVSMSCSSAVGRPHPDYTWTKISPPDKDLPAGRMIQDFATGSLLLKNLTIDFTGTYQCVAKNTLGEETCSLSITVSYNNEAAVIAGAVIGTILGLLLIGGGVGYYVWYKKKQPKVPNVGYNISEDANAPQVNLLNEQKLPASLHEKSNNTHNSISTVRSEFNILV